MDLTKWLGKTVADLSKGMQQKVQFIATIIHEPELIILDEPFSGFDPVNANLLTKEILQLQKNGATIIFSTHRMETVEELCEHICMINKSKVVLNGPKESIKNSFATGNMLLTTNSNIPEIQGVKIDRTQNSNEYLVSKPKEMSTNELISRLIPYVEIRSIAEKLPDMRDIFIDVVTSSGGVIETEEPILTEK
jgi:ABC-2 type transport system ATP-binding protein